MPQTAQALKERAAAIKKKMAAAQGKADPKKMRVMRKRLKRAQRGARSLDAKAKRFAEKSLKKAKAEAS